MTDRSKAEKCLYTAMDALVDAKDYFTSAYLEAGDEREQDLLTMVGNVSEMLGEIVAYLAMYCHAI